MLHSYPRSSWGWQATALVLLALLTPLGIYLASSPVSPTWASATTIAQLVVAAAAASAAALVYFHYRMTRLPALGWMAFCMTVYGVESVTIGLIRVGTSHYHRPGWVLLIDLAVAVGIATIAWLGRNRVLRGDPLGMGLLFGCIVAAAHLELETAGPAIAPVLPFPLVGAVTLSLWSYATYRLVRSTTAPYPWMNQRLALGFLLLTVSRLGGLQDLTGAVPNLVVVIATIGGGVLVLSASLAALRFEIQCHGERLEALDTQVALMEARHRDERSRMHEITNTVAGIAGASNLIRANADLPAQARARIEEMLEQETARLARILAGDYVTPEQLAQRPRHRDLALDDLIRPLVSAQEVVGRTVRWDPSGLHATGDHDGVTEAINILLDNARKHAPGSTTSVEVRTDGDDAVIVVADDGPGIPPDEREQSFERGHRGRRSKGQGLGLHLARTRVEDSGGTLELAPSERGASFVVRLPAAATPALVGAEEA